MEFLVEIATSGRDSNLATYFLQHYYLNLVIYAQKYTGLGALNYFKDIVWATLYFNLLCEFCRFKRSTIFPKCHQKLQNFSL